MRAIVVVVPCPNSNQTFFGGNLMSFSLGRSVSFFAHSGALKLIRRGLLSAIVIAAFGERVAFADEVNLGAVEISQIFSQAQEMIEGDTTGLGLICGPKVCASLDVNVDPTTQLGTMAIQPIIAPSSNPALVILCYLAGRKLLEKAGEVVVTAGITWALTRLKDGVVNLVNSGGATTGAAQPAPVCMPLDINSPLFQAVAGSGANGGTYSAGGFTISVGPLRAF